MRRAAVLLAVLSAARPGAAAPADASAGDPNEVDLLIVVDTSAAAAPLRASLSADVAPFVAQLSTFGELDVHVGVISTDPSDGGALRPAPADCAAAPGLAYLAHGATSNFPGAFADAIVCLLPPAAATGADVARPFATITAALGGGVAANAGFRRPEAGLAVLVITAQDDCSGPGALGDVFACAQAGWSCTPALDAQPGPRTCFAIASPPELLSIETVREAIEASAPPGRVAFGLLAGDPPHVEVVSGPSLAPTCTSGALAPTPALRLSRLAYLFSPTWVGSACDPAGFADFGTAVRELGPSHVYPEDGGYGYYPSQGGCGCRGSSPSTGGLLLVGLSLLGVTRRSSPWRRCRARRARVAG